MTWCSKLASPPVGLPPVWHPSVIVARDGCPDVNDWDGMTSTATQQGGRLVHNFSLSGIQTRGIQVVILQIHEQESRLHLLESSQRIRLRCR